MSWNDWAFDYDVSVLDRDGLSLRNVKYQGRLFIYRMSLPVTRVFYINNVWALLLDLWGDVVPDPLGKQRDHRSTSVYPQRTPIGMRSAFVVKSAVTMSIELYYLSDDGVLDALYLQPRTTVRRQTISLSELAYRFRYRWRGG